MCGGVGIAVTSLYVSRLAASMVPPDLLFVVGSRVGWVWISLYSFRTSLQIDLMWLCFVSVR